MLTTREYKKGFYIYTKILRAVKRNVKNEKAKFYTKPCPDIQRCTINFIDEKFTICKDDNTKNALSKIIFVLESPHKSEYNDTGNPIAPAQGTTGKNFDETIVNFLILSQYYYKCFTTGCYEVWLVNAVQHQVSLALEPKEYRSILFQISWHSFAKDNFMKRLKNLVEDDKNTVIFNACTIGNKIKTKQSKNLLRGMKLSECFISKLVTKEKDINLNTLVQEAIENCDLESYKVSHPSMWNKLIS